MRRKALSRKTILAVFMALLIIGTTACGGGQASNDNVVPNEQSESDGGGVKAADQADEQTTADDTTEMPGEAADDDMAADFLKGFDEICKKSEGLRVSLEQDDLSQTEYNLKSGDLYALWDNTLNDLWKVLQVTLSEDEMESLTAEEEAWIADKEQQISEAGSEVEGGSMQPLVENMKGADLTEVRVRELVKRLPGYSDYVNDEGTAAYEDGNPGMNKEKEPNTDEASGKLFDAFLKSGGSVRVADNFHENIMLFGADYHPAAEYDLDSLITYMQTNAPSEEVKTPEIQYAYLNHPDRNAYVISFFFRLEYDGFTQFFIFSENNGRLEMNYAIDGWSRRYPSINEYGVIYDSGSNGAGSHATTIIVPTADFEYKTLSEQNDNAAGWDFYDPNTGENAMPISDIMSDAFNSEREDIIYVIYSQVIVDGRIYYYYLSDDITQEVVDYIDGIADNYGFTFDGKAAADEAVSAYARELGVEELYQSEHYADWVDY